MSRRRRDCPAGRKSSGRWTHHRNLELHQPDLEAARRFFHFLRRGCIPKNWWFQQRTVCGGGIGIKPAVEKDGEGNWKTGHHPTSASARDLGAEDEALQGAGTSLVFVPCDFQPGPPVAQP